MNPEKILKYRRETRGCAEHIHLNNAGAALMPDLVVEAQLGYLRQEAQQGGYETAAATQTQWMGFYPAVARLINASQHEIAYATNATDAFAKALSAIPFQKGDVVLTTTDDYVSNQLAFLSLQKRQGVQLVRARQSQEGGVDLPHFFQLMEQYRPALVAVTHIPTNSGLIQPVELIGRRCGEMDCWYLVDACQSAGMLPLDVKTIGCDFLSATFRKFLRGPRGAGFLYVSKRALDAGLEPLLPDLAGAHWTEPDGYTPEPSARRFEWWERSYATLVGALAATRYALDVGPEHIAPRVIHLAAQLRRLLTPLPRVQVLDKGPQLGAIVSLHIRDADPRKLSTTLQERKINASVAFLENALLDFKAKGVNWALRLSPHYYNTEEELEQCVAILKELLDANLI